MNRRTFSSVLAAGVATSAFGARAEAQAAVSARNVVFVHGLYADGSCWSEVIDRLRPIGIRTTSVQNALRTFADDVASARRALDAQDGPTVLVAHSYSGMIASQVGVHPNVSAIVYVAARAPDAGEDYATLAARFPTAPAGAGLIVTDGFAVLGETAFLNDFANGVDPAKAHLLYAVQASNATSLTNVRTTAAAWRSKRTWYAVSLQDRTINPQLERYMAARMKATTIELDSGHLSLVSHPQEIANLILSAAGQRS
jgi:pimeloyl-ACP methyl ester carboxylesterase